jgi:taurine dioxygenase
MTMGSHDRPAGRDAGLAIEPLSRVLGASVRGVDLSRPIEPAARQAITDAFQRHGVLCFPGQAISDEDQIRFAGLFGRADVSAAPVTFADGEKVPKRGVMFISNLRENGALVGALPDGELQFHSDGAHRAQPYRATTLYAIKIPSRGGETRFANMYAAYETLPDTLKRQVEGRTARFVYDARATLREQTDETDESLSSAVHPLVRLHPGSGQPALYLSRLMTRNIVGMDRAESDRLLGQLFQHIEQPRFVYAHRWSLSDLLIWDNRCLNHARNDFPAGEERHLRRVTVADA